MTNEAKEAGSKRKTIVKVVSVVSGYHALKRTIGTFQKAAKGIRSIKSEVTDSYLDSESKMRLRDIHDGKEDGLPSRFAIYSHTKKMILHGDDFATCMRDAYTQKEIRKMQNDARLVRRIQSYGSAIVYLSSILISLKLHSIIPLFSLFPAITLVAFALRRGCHEETLKQQKLIDLQTYLSQPGFFAIWK